VHAGRDCPGFRFGRPAQATRRKGSWSVERAYELLPQLAERRDNLGNQLSGGEQQMLTIARADEQS